MFWMEIRRNRGGRYNKLMGNSTVFLDSNTDLREIIGMWLEKMTTYRGQGKLYPQLNVDININMERKLGIYSREWLLDKTWSYAMED